MTIVTRYCPATIVHVESAGDGSFASAAQVDLPSPYTILLVSGPVEGQQAIKLPEGNVGDVVDVFLLRYVSNNAGLTLKMFDADGNYLAGSELYLGEIYRIQKIVAEPLECPVGYTQAFVGTWVAHKLWVGNNWPPE